MTEMMKNPYFTTDNQHFVSNTNEVMTPERMKMIKRNNIFAINVLSKLFTQNGLESLFKSHQVMGIILQGQLEKSDKVTGYNTNNLGDKIKFLILAASDSKHPENLQKIRSSFFAISVFSPILQGCMPYEGGNGAWMNWNKNSTCEAEFKKRTPLNAAAQCYTEDPQAPIGIDMSKLIDALVGTDMKGNYYIRTDFDDLQAKANMTAAADQYLKLLKSSKRFNANFTNPKLIDAENYDD